MLPPHLWMISIYMFHTCFRLHTVFVILIQLLIQISFISGPAESPSWMTSTCHIQAKCSWSVLEQDTESPLPAPLVRLWEPLHPCKTTEITNSPRGIKMMLLTQIRSLKTSLKHKKVQCLIRCLLIVCVFCSCFLLQAAKFDWKHF